MVWPTEAAPQEASLHDGKDVDAEDDEEKMRKEEGVRRIHDDA